MTAENIVRPSQLRTITAAQHQARIAYIFCFQALLMLAATGLFYLSPHITSIIYGNMSFLTHYIPLLWRLSDVLIQQVRGAAIPFIFCAYLSYMALQLVFGSLLAFMTTRILWRLRQDGDRPRWPSVLLIVILIMFLFANIDLYIGLNHIEQSASVVSVVLHAIIIPAANILFYFMIYAKYGAWKTEVIRGRSHELIGDAQE